MIPPSQNLNRFRRNDRQYKWLSTMFDALNVQSDTLTRQEACKNLLTYIGSELEYQQVFEDVAKQFGLVNTPKLDPYSTFAIQSNGNMSNTQMRDI